MYLGKKADIIQEPQRSIYDGIEIKITSKRLKSGKCQVKFFFDGLGTDDCYGYLLVDAGQTLNEVIWKIKSKLMRIGDLQRYHHRRLYSINSNMERHDELLIFKKHHRV